MTKESKWVIACVGLVCCFYLGWFMPFLWLVFLVVALILVATPTKPKVVPHTPQQSVQLAQQTTDNSLIIQQLESRIADERNIDVKRGLHEALVIIRGTDIAASVIPAKPQPTAAPVLVAPIPHISKEEQELRNVNIILYTASFLLVGAAAAFIAVSEGVAPVAKFLLLLVVAAGFYISGLLLHAQSKRLRPAGVAFVGTGLALIPFVGLAGYFYVVPNAPLMWWLTSAVGLVAFIIAVSQLRTSVMAYLTLAFVFSLATSSVSILEAPFIWYFVSIIITGSVLTYISYKRPRWLPASFIVPLEQNAQLAVPVALIGSLFAVDSLQASDYSIISGVAALHYLVNSLGFSTDHTRAPYWSAARALLVVFAATAAYAITLDWHMVSLVLIGVAFLAHGYSVRLQSESRYEQAWLWVSQALVVVALTMWLDSAVAVSAILIALVLISAHQLLVVRRVEYALAGILAGLAVPLTLLRGVAQPPVDYEYIAALLVLVAAACIALRSLMARRHAAFKIAVSAGYMALLAEASVIGLFSGETAWIATILIAAAVLLYGASYVERRPAIAAIANSILVCGTIVAFDKVLGSMTWVPFATAVTLGTVWYLTRWVLAHPRIISQSNVIHANIQTASSISIVVAGGLIAMFQSEQTVVAGSLLACVGAGLLAYEGYVRGVRGLYEVALYTLTFSLQRLFGHAIPDAHLLVYTHWWALTGLVSMLLYQGRTGDWAGAQTRLVIALSILSVPTGLYALANPDEYQWLFLAEHVSLAVFGVLLNKRLLVLWGSIGVGLAVLWLLKSYTYLLLALIAMGLIGLAVWRLMKKQQ